MAAFSNQESALRAFFMPATLPPLPPSRQCCVVGRCCPRQCSCHDHRSRHDHHSQYRKKGCTLASPQTVYRHPLYSLALYPFSSLFIYPVSFSLFRCSPHLSLLHEPAASFPPQPLLAFHVGSDVTWQTHWSQQLCGILVEVRQLSSSLAPQLRTVLFMAFDGGNTAHGAEAMRGGGIANWLRR